MDHGWTQVYATAETRGVAGVERTRDAPGGTLLDHRFATRRASRAGGGVPDRWLPTIPPRCAAQPQRDLMNQVTTSARRRTAVERRGQDAWRETFLLASAAAPATPSLRPRHHATTLYAQGPHLATCFNPQYHSNVRSKWLLIEQPTTGSRLLNNSELTS